MRTCKLIHINMSATIVIEGVEQLFELFHLHTTRSGRSNS
jgi:hypothetical protein